MKPQRVLFSGTTQRSEALLDAPIGRAGLPTTPQLLEQAIGEINPDRLFILTDETTRRLCLPLVQSADCLAGARVITISAGDTSKDLQSVTHVWEQLQRMGATRHSLMVNLGGGMVTDLGGFAASTFKRGIHFINIPTTLLSMVDASVGGKTGFNFGGLKNEIGVFSNSHCVIIDTVFLNTLDRENILSGFAEMLKHGLISTEEHWAQLLTSLDNSTSELHESSLPGKGCDGAPGVVSISMIQESVAVKQRIVDEDPTEHGIRKALNLGHTIGHAFEALSLQASVKENLQSPPILHGYAVAYGLVCELYLSVVKTGFPVDKMRQTVRFIFDHYGRMPITCDDYPVLLELMTHDKKNIAGEVNFTLLGGIGDIRINQIATRQQIEEALDFYREG